MGIGVADFDDDGWTDFFVANDTVPAFLFMNNRNGTFTEAAFERAVAYTEGGAAVSGMGADARDVDNDGRPDVFETALANETFPLFRNTGGGNFEDDDHAIRGRHGHPPALRVGQRHRRPQQRRVEGPVRGLRRRDGCRRARSASASRWPTRCSSTSGTAASRTAARGRGEAFARKAVHRGAAFGDIDNDGRVDVVVTALDGALELWRNVSQAPHHWLMVQAVGTKSNRDGAGAKIRIVTAKGAQHAHVNTAVGYGGASDRRVHFGLGGETAVGELTITWPSGKTQTLKKVAADQVLTVREPD